MAPISVFDALEPVDISDMTAELPLGPADAIKHGRLPNGLKCVASPNWPPLCFFYHAAMRADNFLGAQVLRAQGLQAQGARRRGPGHQDRLSRRGGPRAGTLSSNLSTGMVVSTPSLTGLHGASLSPPCSESPLS